MLKKLYRNVSQFGLIDGVRLSFSPPQGVYTLKPKRLGAPLYLRQGTTDIDVLRTIFFAGSYEMYPLRKMCPNFRPRTIADCGAYAGYSARFFAMKYPEARILAVEPNEENFAMLTKNVAGIRGIEVVNKAAWYESTTVFLADPSVAKWRFEFEGNSTGKGGGGVETITMPEIVQWAGGEIDILKIDIEGAELEIFEQDCSWLDHVNVLIIEVHDGQKFGCSRSVWKQLVNRKFCMLNQHECLMFIQEKMLTAK